LIGPNGAGKTTLFNLVSGFYPVDSGEVLFQGQKITNFPPHECCHLGIGRTFQTVKTFAKHDVLYNVTVAALPRMKGVKEAQESALEILSFVGLAGKKDHLGGALTLADRKRLEIARALATDPKLLLLDEPASGLNVRETEEVGKLIQKIRDTGKTVVVVEHDMSLVMEISEEVLVLDHGRRIAEGPPRQVQKDPDVLRVYLGEDISHAAGAES